MNHDQFVAHIRRRLRGRPVIDLAKELGVARSYLNEVINRTRDPGPKLLNALGLKMERHFYPMSQKDEQEVNDLSNKSEIPIDAT